MARDRRMKVEPLEDRRMLATFTVTNYFDGVVAAAGDLPGSLRQAIFDANAAAGADEIQFDESLAGARISLTQGELQITDELTLTGLGADLLTIDASGSDPTPTMKNGDGSGIFQVGGGVDAVTVADLMLTGADGGAVISSPQGLVTLNSSRVTGNHTTESIVYSKIFLHVNDCEFTGNSAATIISCNYQMEIAGATISNNSGRGVSTVGGWITIADSTISGNTADKGAGIYLKYDAGSAEYSSPGHASDATITNTLISGNTATHGSAIYGVASGVTLIDSTVSGNLGADAAISFTFASVPHIGDVGGRVDLQNTHVVDNEGDGIRTNFAPTIADSDISGNTGTGLDLNDSWGLSGAYGAIVNISNSSFNNNARGLVLYGPSYVPGFGHEPMSVTIQGSQVNNNTTDGGLTLLGTPKVEVIGTTISGNHNTVSGGGILDGRVGLPTLAVHNSTVSGNSSGANGGGIAVYGNLTIEESTISGNAAGEHGGGIWLSSQSTTNVRRSTIANNSAGGMGGGVVFNNSAYRPDYGSLDIAGSIIADNTATSEPDLVPDDASTIRYSLIENPGSATITGTGNILGVDPMLGPLQDNGGPTFTHALLPGSPAIDAGDPAFTSPPDYDQRGEGFERVIGERVDMGSYEAFLLIVTTELSVVDPADGLLSLVEAIEMANAMPGADEITFSSSLASKTIVGSFEITEELTITGLGADQLTINGGFSVVGGVFQPVTISELTIAGSAGRAIYNELSEVTLNSVHVTGNQGGGIDVRGGTLNITDSTISGNTAAKGAAIYLAGHVYGYFDVFSSATITNSLISGNTATKGSAIYGLGSDVTLIDSTVSGNLGAEAAIQMELAEISHFGSYIQCHVSLQNSGVINNEGDGIRTGLATVADSDVSGNAGTGLFLDAFNSGSVNISNSKFNGNATGLVLQSVGWNNKAMSVTIRRSEVKNNTTGGGLVLPNSWTEVVVDDTTISGNHSTGSGGGIYSNSVPLLIRSSTISGNSADGKGGGVNLFGTLTIQDSTISGNTSQGSGGGLSVFSTGPAAVIERSTIVNNSAGTAGGGLSTYSVPYSSNNGAEIRGSIIANNTAATGPDLVGLEDMAVSYSLIEDLGTTTITGTGNILGVDPMLGPLQDNGGPTFTHALLPGSPAINAGDPAFTSPPDYDQRGEGFERVVNGRIDIGAFEVQSPTSGDFDGDGDVDGRDFLAWQRGFGSTSATQADGDADHDEDVDGDDLGVWQGQYGEAEIGIEDPGVGTSESALMIAESEDAVTSDPGDAIPGLGVIQLVRPARGADRDERVAVEDRYVEEVDRAFDSFAPVTQFRVREFGEMVVRSARLRCASRLTGERLSLPCG